MKWLSALFLLLMACERYGPSRPANVPSDAAWAGGDDGGVWVRCGVDLERDVNPCEIFADVTGVVIASGDYILAVEMRAAAGDELRHSFSFADGTGIRLGTSQRLVPIEELSANDHIVPGGYRERILKRLDHFRDINNVYRRNAAYLTNIPATGELAYLNTIFMAVPQSVRQALELDLGVPISLQRFYAELNGLFLLQTIHVFGFRPSAGYLLSREPFEGMAYPLAPATPAPDSGNARIVFGSYWFDGSQLLVDVETGEVFCYVGREQSQLRARWPSFDDWLDSELDRLIPMFDAEGNTDVPLEQRLPGPERD